MANDTTAARQAAQDAKGTVREEARQAAETVKEEAGAIADQATTLGREHAEQRFEQGKGALEEQVDTIHSAVDGAARRLREENSPFASYAGELSDQLSRFSNGIENSTLDDVAVRTRRVARENPGLFVLGSVVAGIAAGRFFKASAARDHRDDDDDDYRAGREAAMARYRTDYRSPVARDAAPYRPRHEAGVASAPGVIDGGTTTSGAAGRVPMESGSAGGIGTSGSATAGAGGAPSTGSLGGHRNDNGDN